MSAGHQSLSQLGEIEQRLSEITKYLASSGPAPRVLQGSERALLTQFVGDHPDLIDGAGHTGLKRFLGRNCVLPDGRLLIIPYGRPDWAGLLFQVWGSAFGACLRIHVRTRPTPKQSVLIPNDPEFSAFKLGRLVVGFWHGKRLEVASEYDYYRCPDHARALAEIVQIAEETHRALFDDPNVFWDRELILASSVPETSFGPWFSHSDWLQRGWVKNNDYRDLLLKISAELPAKAEKALQCMPLREYAVLGSAMAIAKHPGSARERLRALLEMFADARIAWEFFGAAVWLMRSPNQQAQIEELAGEAIRSLGEIWQIGPTLDPKGTNWGRRQPYFDSGRRTLDSYSIDVDGLPIDRDEEAENYWRYRPPIVPFDAPEYLDPWDMHIDPKLLVGWEALDLDPDAATATVGGLLEEANALRKWTIPAKAHVDLRFGPFQFVEVTEVGDEVHFVWRSPDLRYFMTSVNPRSQTFLHDDLFDNSKVGTATRLLMAALVRDFWVMEERHNVFDVKIERAPRFRGKPGIHSRVVYLPRVRYASSGMRVGRLSDELQHSARARHYVRPFFRKADTPSRLQLEIANRHNISVPPGHTYVRGHYRGGGVNQAIYRSRSAFNLLYDISSGSSMKIGPIAEDWFAFERAIASLLEEHLNYTILDRAVRGRGDHGIDVLATRGAGDRTELWVVQCKHYAEGNPVRPAIIRELLGSMATVQHDDDHLVRGMLVTTGRITGDALKIAASHGVHTYDGAQLSAICGAINREARPHPTF